MCSGQTESPTASEKAPQTLSQTHNPRNTRWGAAMAGALPGFLVPGCTLITCPAGHLAWVRFCQYLDFDEKLTSH